MKAKKQNLIFNLAKLKLFGLVNIEYFYQQYNLAYYVVLKTLIL